jgi:hypothetical protein
MKNTENVIYYQNIVKLKEVDQFISNTEKRIQGAIDQFKKVGVDISINELQSLFFGEHDQTDIKTVSNFIRTKLVSGKESAIQGLTIDTESLRQLVKIPDLMELMAMLKEFEKAISPRLYHIGSQIYWEFLELDKKNKVKFSKAGKDYINSGLIHIATTPEQRQRVIEVQRICDILQEYFIKDEIKEHLLCDSRFVLFSDNKFYPGKKYIETGRL